MRVTRPATSALLLSWAAACGAAPRSSNVPSTTATHASEVLSSQPRTDTRATTCSTCDSVRPAGPTSMPSVRWSVATADRVIATPIEFAAGIAVGSLDGTLYAVADDGTSLFSVATGAPIRGSARSFGAGLIVANEIGDVLFVGRSGEIRWRTSLRSPVVTAPVSAPQDSHYIAANGIYRLDHAGNVLWHHIEATTIYAQPTRTNGGGDSYTTVDGRDVVLSTTGDVLSQTPHPPQDENAPKPPPIVVIDRDGHRYFADTDQTIVGEDRDGRTLFRYSLGAHVAGSVLLTSTGTLIVGADDGKLYALR